MKCRGKLSKWVWLVLIAAFAAIAGGGCGGSSSYHESGNVTEINRAEHPLAAHLREMYDQMPKGTVFLSEGITSKQLEDMKDKLKAAFEEGKIIGMYAPAKARIEALYDSLGVDLSLSRKGTANGASASAADDEGEPEFFMITKRNGSIFQKTVVYIDGDPEAEPISVDVSEAMSRDFYIVSYDRSADGKNIKENQIHGQWPDVHLDELGNVPDHDGCASAYHPTASDEDGGRLRDKSERYPEMAASIVEWNDKVEKLAADIEAEIAPMREAISAADFDASIEKIGAFLHDNKDFHFSDIKGESVGPIAGLLPVNAAPFRFPTLHVDTRVYSCYSFDHGNNYYMVIQSSSMNPDKNYRHGRYYVDLLDHVENSTYGYESSNEVKGISDTSKVHVEKNAPKSYSKTTGHTDGVSFSLDGSVGVSGTVGLNGKKPNASASGNLGLSAGIGISHEKTYDVDDLNIEDLTDDPVEKVRYNFTVPDVKKKHTTYEELDDASAISRSTYASEESWVWRVSREDDPYKFTHNFTYKCLHMRGHARVVHAVNVPGTSYVVYQPGSASHEIPLPPPPTLGIDNFQLILNSDGYVDHNNDPVTLNLISDGAWRIECPDEGDWVHIAEKSGDQTSNAQLAILLQIDKNPGKDIRKTRITVTGPDGADGVPQTATLDIQQEGKK